MTFKISVGVYIKQVDGYWQVTAPQWAGTQCWPRDRGSNTAKDSRFTVTTFIKALDYANSCVILAKVTKPTLVVSVILVEQGKEIALTDEVLPFYLLKYSS